MTEKHDERPFATYETGLDEAFLIGTKADFLKLAQTIIEVLDTPVHEGDYHGIHVKQCGFVHALTHPLSEIGLDGLLVVENQTEKRDLFNKTLLNNGNTPIDWQGYDARE